MMKTKSNDASKVIFNDLFFYSLDS